MAARPKPKLPPRQGGNSISSNNDNDSRVNIVESSSEDTAAQKYGMLTDGTSKNIPSWPAQDWRTSSQHSLVPSESDVQNHRRKLLLVYVHGFMGNETSFRSFPAHVHHLLTILLAETHVVHTKIYPRYRSKKNISFARDNFSEWLKPHEDIKTDVVLLGHSMGGLLCSEVVLKPSTPPATTPLAHRILGTINLDVPFLGMHPGVVRSGLASIFKPAEETHHDEFESSLTPTPSHDTGSTEGSSTQNDLTPRRSDTLWQPNLKDPNFNTPFPNDVKLPVRTGWESAWHFLSKHSKDLKGATKNLVSSHMEFGGAMANYGELKSRYGRIRLLEEPAADVRKSLTNGETAPSRVRFINYYTASTGRPKKSKEPPKGEIMVAPSEPPSSASADESPLAPSETSASVESAIDPKAERVKAPDIIADPDDSDWDAAARSLTIEDPHSEMRVLEPSPVADTEDHGNIAAETVETPLSTSADPSVTALSSTSSSTMSLPALPELPRAPPPLDVSFIQDVATRKMVEKEHARASKAYLKAVKEREKSIAEWRKREQKREKSARQATERAEKDAAKAELLTAKAREKENITTAQDTERKASIQKANESERPMTHREQEELRLLKEKQRMEAEALRMSGQQNNEVNDGRTESSNPTASAMSKLTEDRSPSISLHGKERESSREDISQRLGKVEPKSSTPAPVKDRMFCSLPPKDANGQLDPCWVRIFMKDVDEVGAHCGLFFIDERYERLVGEIADRIEVWVKEDMDTRAVLEALGERPD
nr:hypothetical protein CFP56_42086 [Quercus suber]